LSGRAQSLPAVYVDSGIEGEICRNYDPSTRSCGTGTDTAYRRLSTVLPDAVAGTIVLMRGGTYSDQLAPAKSGTPGAPVTFRGYPGEQVRLTAGPAISLLSRDYIVIDGLRVENTTWLEARNSHHNVLQNCFFSKSPAAGTSGNIRFVQSDYNQILNNRIEEAHDNVVLIASSHNLVQANTILQGRHSVIGIRCGSNNIIRGNYFANSLQKIGEVYDCGEDTSAVPHAFNATKQNVFENNIFADASSYYSSSGGNGIQYGGQQGIIRRNVFYHCNIGLGMAVYGDESLYNTDNHVYHNVFYDNDGAGISAAHAALRNAFKNNILFSNKGTLPDCFGISPGQLSYRTSPGPTSRFENNDFFYQHPGDPVIEEEFSAGRSVTQAGTLFPGVFINTLEVDPQFVDVPGYDFHLAPGSPLRDAGTWLTKTAGAGTGAVLSLENAGAFCDGFGIPGEQGDLIRMEGQTEVFRIIRIDYPGNTVTVDRDLAWSSGQGVSLAFEGTAPDVGAFESGSGLTGIESWRSLKFGMDVLNPGISGDLEDPDDDGISNLLEYGLGGEPRVADASILPGRANDGDRLTLVFTRDETLTDLTYSVEAADTLSGDWITIAEGANGSPLRPLIPGVVAVESGLDAVKTVRVSDVGGEDKTRRFLRLRIGR
jgi:hypothetical protein